MTHKSQKCKSENKSSSLLSKEDNELVFSYLGHKCQTVATTVVQLFLTEPPDHETWIYHDCGVLCLVKDNKRRSFFFRIYCLERKLIWEHEIYNYIDYTSPCSYLHSFEGEGTMVGFNFADEDEASTFYNVLIKKIKSRKHHHHHHHHHDESNNTSVSSSTSLSVPYESKKLLSTSVPVNGNSSPKVLKKQIFKESKKNKERKGRLTKADIGEPQGFSHITHVGSKNGFKIENIMQDPNLLNFFRKAGVSQSQLNDKETRDFIYDFINKHGGVDAIVKEEKKKIETVVTPELSEPPPVPARGMISSQSQDETIPPPLPSRNRRPPPARKTPTPAPRKTTSNLPSRPLPPIPVNDNIPSTEQSMKPKESEPDPRTALLQSIRDGKHQLKSVQTIVREPSFVNDTRDELLKEIRSGVKLKPVIPNPKNNKSKHNLAGALASALAIRSLAMHSDSDSASSSEDDINEWD